MSAIEVGFLDEPIERSVRLAEGDTKSSRLVHRMTEYAGRALCQLRQVGGTEEIIAVEREELLRAEVFPAGQQGVAGAARLLLPHHLPLREMRLLAQVRLHLLAQVVGDNQHTINFLG